MLPAGAVGPDQAASLAKPQRLLAAPATAPCHRARSWLPQPPPRRWHGSRTGRRRGEPPCSFIRSLEVPGWILPSWLSPNDPANPRTLVRQQRLRQLRRQLKDSARQPALLLPVPAGEESASCGVAGSNGSNGSNGGSGGSGEAGTAVDVTHSASNAVPFTAGAQGNAASSLTVALNGGAASVCRADEVRTVLPWLFAAEGRLDFTAMEHMASSWALSGLQLLDVTRFAAAAGAANGHWHSSWGSHVRWAGPQALPSPAVAAAAALRRMELRRGGALGSLPEMDGKAVVVTFHPQHRQLAAETLALYLHTYLGLSGQEAVEAAGRATGSAPLESTLRQSMQELATIADGWYRRVTLAWPYAGGHVEVVGDAVCGWDQRAPMVFNVKKKRWQLQIWGLQPGIHRFKYLVDGCWVIDLAGHTEADSRGNINNVVLVTSRPTALLSTLSGDSGTDDDLSGSSSEEGEGQEEGAGVGITVQGLVGGSDSGGSGDAVSAAAAAAAAAVPQPSVLATAEPPEASAAGGDGMGQEVVEQVVPPWESEQEMEAMARFGAAVLAFHTRLGVQLRHKLH